MGTVVVGTVVVGTVVVGTLVVGTLVVGTDVGEADGCEVGRAVGAGEYDTWKSNESVIEDSSAQDNVSVYVLTSTEPGTT